MQQPFKCTIDLLLTVAALAVLSPVLLAVAAGIRLRLAWAGQCCFAK